MPKIVANLGSEPRPPRPKAGKASTSHLNHADAGPRASSFAELLHRGASGTAAVSRATLIRRAAEHDVPDEDADARAERARGPRERQGDDEEDSAGTAPFTVVGEAPTFAWRPPGSPDPPTAAGSAAAATAPNVDELFAQLVRSAAVGGDARRASMRLELGGRVVGKGHVVVHADGDEVEIEIAAPSGVDAARLETRVAARLAQKGFRVTRFECR